MRELGISYNIYLYLAVGFIILMNILGFWVMGSDKKKAKRKQRRVPERNFFLIAVFGGALGVYAGMLFFRHKTKRWYFMVGIPGIFIAEVIISYLLLK